jgi:phosphoglucomutase
MSSAILDIQCVLKAGSEYIIKEMSVIDTETWATQHWIFKHYNNRQDGSTRRTNKWLEKHYHGLPIEYGDVEYEEIERILNSLKFDTIYVKGEQKQKMINEFIPHTTVYNI